MDRGAWWATVHVVTKSWTRLSDEHTHTVIFPGKVQRLSDWEKNDIYIYPLKHKDIKMLKYNDGKT